MNIEQSIKDRIEKRLLETKTPCKFYVRKNDAIKVADKMARTSADHFDCDRPAHYLIVLVDSVKKYAIAFDINELTSRPESKGGYVGIFGAAGHYSF